MRSAFCLLYADTAFRIPETKESFYSGIDSRDRGSVRSGPLMASTWRSNETFFAQRLRKAVL